MNVNSIEQGERLFFIISEGGKTLNLDVYTCYGIVYADTQLVNNGSEKRHGDTTAAYKMARNVIEVEASKRGKPVNYFFKTEFSQMEQWARDPERGLGIFPWDFMRREKDYFCAKIKIFPPGYLSKERKRQGFLGRLFRGSRG